MSGTSAIFGQAILFVFQKCLHCNYFDVDCETSYIYKYPLCGEVKSILSISTHWPTIICHPNQYRMEDSHDRCGVFWGESVFYCLLQSVEFTVSDKYFLLCRCLCSLWYSIALKKEKGPVFVSCQFQMMAWGHFQCLCRVDRRHVLFL